MSDQIIVAAEMSSLGAAFANTGQPKRLQPLEPIKQTKAGVLDVGHDEIGASDGPPVLLHEWPYDIHSYADVAPLLAALERVRRETFRHLVLEEAQSGLVGL